MGFSRGDKKLHITFNEMGHGDFVMISLPNGKMVVIDCGTMRWDGNYWNPPRKPADGWAHALRTALGDARFFLNKKTIDALILTHPDKDHCSFLQDIFNGNKQLKLGGVTSVAEVFFSNTFGEFGKQGVPKVLAGKTTSVYAINIAVGNTKYAKVKSHGLKGTDFEKTVDIIASAKDKAEILKKSAIAATLNFVKILDGTAADDVDCGVYLLASNVVEYNNITDNSTQDNRGSIVTMIIYGDKKFLFMGDSTFNTEHFLKQTYGDLIKDVEVLHVPHHASYATSSEAEFVKHINPCYAVVTAAWDTGPSLGLPRYEVLDRYIKGSRLLNKPDDVDSAMKKISCYHYKTVTETTTDKNTGKTVTKTGKGNVWVEIEASKHLWCTGSHGPIDFDYEKAKSGKVERIVAKVMDVKDDKDGMDQTDDKVSKDTKDEKSDG